MAVSEREIHYLEIVTPDPEAVRDLYGKTYGWSFEPMVPELGNAFVADLPGGGRCGIRAPMHAEEKPTVRTYVQVSDLAKSVEVVSQSGAEILLERMEIPGHGVIAIYALGGIEHGLWQV